MFFSTFLSVFCFSVANLEMPVLALNIAYFLAHIPIYANSLFALAIVSFHLISMIFEVNPSFVIDKKLLITVGSAIIGIAKFWLSNALIILIINGSKAEFDLFETGFLLLTVLLLAIVVILFKLKMITITKPHVTVAINSFVYILFLLLSHLPTIVLVVFEPGISFTFGGYASNVYYLPFLWIFSIYIVEIRTVQDYIKKNGKSCEVPEFQLTYITVQ
ncbi:hypothetical protein CAEBREN_02285 [Caenorhabditis brenneri]|uniref:Uncharacterized protein n=1 Tax=Caenorhabditis brenneri TaxID=135651 RepID=G0NFX0_CAEBE|nr:hypothetical protein CAEBREN_02285 [Caenorhabditis brenneri]